MVFNLCSITKKQFSQITPRSNPLLELTGTDQCGYSFLLNGTICLQNYTGTYVESHVRRTTLILPHLKYDRYYLKLTPTLIASYNSLLCRMFIVKIKQSNLHDS